MDVLMAVDIIRRAAEGVLECRELREDLGFEQMRALPMRERAAGHCRQRRERAVGRSGAKPEVSGLNGPVSVTCRPMAARVDAASRSALASSREKLGAAVITEVALSRPREIRSRIAALTAGEMP